jgi:GntR family transcriptional repressor for pyruvate dehydrogenase complex
MSESGTATSSAAASGTATETRPIRFNSAAHKIPKMAEVIAADLRAKILAGELVPGESLFTESALMDTYEVSRPTLREALRLLEAQNLVTVRRGSHRGPVVSLPDISVAAQAVAIQLQLRNATLGDVYRFRSFFEPQAVRLVAQNATPAELDRLRAIAADLASKRGNTTAFAATAWTFHQALIEIGGNSTMSVVAETLHRISQEHSTRYMEDLADPEVQQGRAVRSFERLIGILETRDGQAAEEFWITHMTAVYGAMAKENSETLISGIFR